MKIDSPRLKVDVVKNVFVLVEDYEINGHLVPKGLRTDGLSIKTRLARLIVNRYEPKFMPFAIFHDHFTNEELYKFADDEGEKILFSIEKSWRTRFGMWAIRKYHKLKGVT